MPSVHVIIPKISPSLSLSPSNPPARRGRPGRIPSHQAVVLPLLQQRHAPAQGVRRAEPRLHPRVPGGGHGVRVADPRRAHRKGLRARGAADAAGGGGLALRPSRWPGRGRRRGQDHG